MNRRRVLLTCLVLLVALALASALDSPPSEFETSSSLWFQGSADSDGDGLSDDEENNTTGTDPDDNDTDDDRLLDGEEVNQYLTDPNDNDSDNDSLLDGDEILDHGTDPLDNDTDDDGLEDADEIANGTDPTNDDSDGDGTLDGAEVESGRDPLVPDAEDEDGGDAALDDSGASEAFSVAPRSSYLAWAVLFFLFVTGLLWALNVLARRRGIEHPRRTHLMQLIEGEPGILFTQLRDRSGMANGQAVHHLSRLESDNKVISHKMGNKRQYYLSAEAPDREMTVPERILDHVQSNPGIAPSGVARELDLSRQLVHYHVKRLEKKEKVRSEELEDGMALYPVRKLALEAHT